MITLKLYWKNRTVFSLTFEFTFPVFVRLGEIEVVSANIYSICYFSDTDRASRHWCNLGDKLEDLNFQPILTKDVTEISLSSITSSQTFGKEVLLWLTPDICNTNDVRSESWHHTHQHLTVSPPLLYTNNMLTFGLFVLGINHHKLQKQCRCQTVNIKLLWCYQDGSYQPAIGAVRIQSIKSSHYQIICVDNQFPTKHLIKISPPAVRMSKSGVNYPHNHNTSKLQRCF